MDKTRVLEIIKGVDIGGVNGGAERFALDLARALDRRRFDVRVCAFFQQGNAVEREWVERARADGIEIFFAAPWKGNNHFGSYMGGMRAVRATARRWQVDIAHSHFQLGTLSAIELKLRRLAAAAARTAHNTVEWEAGWYGRARQALFSGWLFPLLLDAEVGVSQAAVNQMAAHPGARRSGRAPRLIYNAIAAAWLLPPEELPQPASFDHSGCQPVIGTAGRLAEQKGQAYLIQALPEMLRRFPGLRLVVLGDGPLHGELVALAERLGVSAQVEFPGNRPDMTAQFARMDLFVLPSLWEGLPTVIMESMARGVPVLATDIDGTRELISHARSGWLAPPRDPPALARAACDLLADAPLRAALAQNAYHNLERFTIESVAQQYARLFDELMAARGSNRHG